METEKLYLRISTGKIALLFVLILKECSERCMKDELEKIKRIAQQLSRVKKGDVNNNNVKKLYSV